MTINLIQLGHNGELLSLTEIANPQPVLDAHEKSVQLCPMVRKKDI